MNIQNEVRALCKPHFGNTNNFRITCPACNPIRKNKKDKCLSVIIKDDRILYDCKHCGESGSAPVQLVEFEPKREPIKDEDIKKMKDISISQAKHYRYLMESRNIKKEIIDKFEIITAKKYFPKLEKEADAVGFPYKNGKEVYAIKFRAIEDKAHTQEGLGAQTFFGVDFIDPKEPVVICEGELDCLSYWSAGIQAMSVPNGAPVKVSENRVDPSEDKKFQYVWKAKELLDECEKILICTDTDEAGIALAEELARRIGKAKCWQTEYPTGCKDGNDVLVAHGEQSLRDIVDRAEVWPITGLRTADFYLDDVQRLYEGGLKKGEPTGFHNIDRLMSICTGHMSIVTGIPSSGKSSFLDAMMVNLAQIRDWKFAVCSFENDPATHISQLCEKYMIKPFAEGVTERMSKDEMIKAQAWVNDHFVFIDHNNGEKATLDSILDRAVGAVQRMGVRGLVIDPYSYIDLQRGNRSETEAVGDMLTRVRLFAKHHDVHVWFVAHPAKMVREGGSIAIPQGYDISGSAHWFNHCDIGFSVARIFVDEVQCERVMVKVWKMRYRWMGMQGEEWLDFDVPTGTYSEPPAEKGWAWDIDD